MIKYAVVILVVNILILKTHGLWDKDARCPLICTCRLEHLSETAIYRFMQGENKEPPNEVESTEINNEVLYEENLEKVLLEEKPIVRSTTCILQTETNPEELIEKLPKDIESLTLIQGYESGNKTVKFSYLTNFPQLISLELIGANLLNKKSDSHLICEIDKPFSETKYLNLERILIKNSKNQIQNFVKEIEDQALTFEYVQRFDSESHPLTMVQKDTDEEVVPYEVFKKQTETNEVPLFVGFKNLLLLRITSCELNSVHWEMFDGLQNLQLLILEKNNLRFIPAFAFYGTPNLKKLSLAHNSLLDIQITDLAGLLELEYLDLTYNNFSQLSELSLPPFPKLKLANFANNPISVIFPNTFEVMNTTDSLVIGSDDMPLSLLANSFLGLNLLKTLTLNNLNIKFLKREFLVGMPNLQQLTLTGNITHIEFDTFLDVYRLEKLIMANCQIRNISMDAFIGMEKLRYLDLSKNKLEYLSPGVFDQLINIRELYLNGNQLTRLPPDIFSHIHPRLLRLNDNPWHCSCEMGSWKPMIVNRIKQKLTKKCDFSADKGVGCTPETRIVYKYAYNNRVAPRCATPKIFANWSVFHLMRRQLRCPNYRPKLRKHPIQPKRLSNNTSSEQTQAESNENNTKPIYTNQSGNKVEFNTRIDMKKSKEAYLNYKLLKHESLQHKKNLMDMKNLHDLNNFNVPNNNNHLDFNAKPNFNQPEIENDLNPLHPMINSMDHSMPIIQHVVTISNKTHQSPRKRLRRRKFRKHNNGTLINNNPTTNNHK